jgi:hypothetical protein
VRKLRRRAEATAGFALLAAIAVVLVAQPASANRSAVSAGNCSRAAADQAILAAHREANPGDKHPAAQVLCNVPVFGAGVDAMVASVRIPSCGRTGDWLVWRFDSGKWQQVFESLNGADLVAVGAGIKETQFVLRPGDAHCFPTGGTRSRVWHWNGTKMVSGAWRYSKPAAKRGTKPSKLFYFVSPSRNIYCATGDEDIAYCSSRSPRQWVELRLNGRMRSCVRPGCYHGSPPKVSGVAVLAYGRINEQGGFRCKSQMSGMTCTIILRGSHFAYGKGFKISRSGVARVG